MQLDDDVIKYEILVEELSTNEALVQLLRIVAEEEGIPFETLKASMLAEAAKAGEVHLKPEKHYTESVLNFIGELKESNKMKSIKEKSRQEVEAVPAVVVAGLTGAAAAGHLAVATTTVWQAFGMTVMFGTASAGALLSAAILPAAGAFVAWKGIQAFARR